MKAPYTWLKNTALVGGLAFALSAVVACSNSNKSSSGGTVCAPNMVFDGVSCVVPTSTGLPAGTQIGFYTQSSNMGSYYNQGGSQMNLGSGFVNVLRDAMGTCDRTVYGGGYSGGLAACNQWVSGYHDMVILIDGSAASTAKLIMRSSPQVNPFANYYYSIPSFKNFILGAFGFGAGNISGVFNPLVLDMTLSPAFQDAGFEMRSQGPTASYAWGKLIQLQVPSGKIEDPALGFTMYIDDGNRNMATAVSGKMVRCQTQNCGLTGF